MFVPNDELMINYVNAKRKGNSHHRDGTQSPCRIGVTLYQIDEESPIAIRTEDSGGVSPIVVLLNRVQAEILLRALQEAIGRV